ncbi:helix-turn-helix transcriptional regulator [Peribacillus frigoritolerans]|uniref:helix-turn-helix domain-containing protein n=1 Tax=Peribacillus frigoritolerans TaxID=450367 RepID=UPI0032B33CBD
MKKTMKIDGKKLRMARAEKGWSKTDLFLQSGISRKTLYNIEHSECGVRVATMAKLADCLGKPLEFFEDEEPSQDSTEEVIQDILDQCEIANQKHGDGADYTSGKWLTIALEEFGEVSQALQIDEPWSKETDKSDLYGEIIDTATVLVRWASTLKLEN